MIAILGAVLFGGIAVLTLLVTFGFPLGEFTLSGKYKVLPQKMRITTAVSFLIQVFAITTILQAGAIIPLWFSISLVRGICYFFAVYLSINTFMNFLSSSKKEKYVMTPLALITAVCFWISAITM